MGPPFFYLFFEGNYRMEEKKQSGFTERSKDKFKRYVEEEIKKLFTGVLDYTEVAIDGADRFKALRSKILKLGNDAIRDISREIDNRYIVTYVSPAEDIIIVNKK